MLILALRNIRRNLPRLRPMIIIMGLSFFLLFSANSVLSRIDSSMESAYLDTLTGEYSISAPGEEGFTLFGSEAILVGDLLVPPAIPDFPALESMLIDQENVRYTALVSSAAQLQIGNVKSARVVLGVDFDSYISFFPDFDLVLGGIPDPGEPGILLQEAQYESLLASTGRESLLGAEAVLTVAYETSFTIRQVPVTGVYRYPVRDSLLDRVVLVDADTARSLNGYVYGAQERTSLDEPQKQLLDSSLDDLFSFPGMETEDPADIEDPASPGSGVLDSIDSLFSTPTSDTLTGTGIGNAWTFVLLRSHGGAFNTFPRQNLSRKLAGLPEGSSLQLRDWRRTLGGNVLLVWFLSIILNTGIWFVIFGASLVAVNAIVLSVLERRKEIGSMRAIGARRSSVARMVIYEVSIVMLASAAAGILLGVAGILTLNYAELRVSNSYLLLLFGGGAVRGEIGIAHVFLHLFWAFVLSLLASIYPVKKILDLKPVRAMQ